MVIIKTNQIPIMWEMGGWIKLEEPTRNKCVINSLSPASTRSNAMFDTLDGSISIMWLWTFAMILKGMTHGSNEHTHKIENSLKELSSKIY